MLNSLTDHIHQQENFLSNLNHELRTPIHTICVISELLKASSSDEQQKETLEQLVNASTRLTQLLNQALCCAHQQQTLSVEETSNETLDLDAWLKNWIFKIHQCQSQTKFELTNLLPSAFFLHPLSAYHKLLDPILLNCLRSQNTLILLEEAPEDHIKLTISNDGAFIPKKLEPFVFYPFVKGDRFNQAKLGLGLYQSQRYATYLQARLSLKNTPPKGVCYQILLPRKPASRGTN